MPTFCCLLKTVSKRVENPLFLPLCATNPKGHGCFPMRRILEGYRRMKHRKSTLFKPRGRRYQAWQFSASKRPVITRSCQTTTYGTQTFPVSVKFSSVIHLTVDNYYLRGFGLISISVSLWQVFPWGKKLHKRLYALPGILAYSSSVPHSAYS